MKLYKILLLLCTTVVVAQNDKRLEKKHLEDSIYYKLKESRKLSENYQYKKAINLIITYTELASKMNNDSLVGVGYSALSAINTDLGNDTLALSYSRKAEKIFMKIKYYDGLEVSYTDMAYIHYEKRKDIDSSLYFVRKSIEFSRKRIPDGRLAVPYYNLGELLNKSNQLNTSIIALDSAIHYAKKYQRVYVLSLAYQELSSVFYKKNKIDKSLEYINRSLKIAKNKEFKDVLAKLYQLKYNILKEQHQYKSSLVYLKKYREIINTLRKEEKTRLLKLVAAKFELKEREKLLKDVILKNQKQEDVLKKTTYFKFLIIVLLIISILSTFFVNKNNTLKKETNTLLLSKNKELKELQLKTELNFLKTQIQPHFFFEVLDNLYVLVSNKVKKAKDIVLKLSELMQYNIYETQKDKVSIWDEIENIKNYLEIINLYKEKETISTIQINGDLSGIFVPPLLYFSSLGSGDTFYRIKNKEIIIIFSNINDTHLLFQIKNITPLKKDVGSDKIKLKNVKRRLDLLYQNNYSLINKSTETTFDISLKIPI